jgi:hypothetical protein
MSTLLLSVGAEPSSFYGPDFGLPGMFLIVAEYGGLSQLFFKAIGKGLYGQHKNV